MSDYQQMARDILRRVQQEAAPRPVARAPEEEERRGVPPAPGRALMGRVLQDWGRAYEREHGFAPGQGNNETTREALANKLWSEDLARRRGSGPTQAEWEQHYEGYRSGRDQSWARYLAGADELMAPPPAPVERVEPPAVGRYGEAVPTAPGAARTRNPQTDRDFDLPLQDRGPRPGSAAAMGRSAPHSDAGMANLDRAMRTIGAARNLLGGRAGNEEPADTGWQMPFEGAPRMTQGWLDNPANYRRFGLPGNTGIDYGMPVGTPIRPVAPGTVVKTGYDETGFGNYVLVRHEDGSETRYSHLDKINVRQGQQVGADARLGLSGNTGNSTGPHLDFTWYPEGTKPSSSALYGAADPTALLRAAAAPRPPAATGNQNRAASASTPFSNEIETAAAKYNLDPNLLRAVIRAESNFDPEAYHRATYATGLMQVLPREAATLGPAYSWATSRPARSQLRDPAYNIDYGARFLAGLIQQFGGDVEKGVQAYHDGADNVQRGHISPNGRVYVPRVMGYYQEYQAQQPATSASTRQSTQARAGTTTTAPAPDFDTSVRSPNYNERPQGTAPSAIVLHATAGNLNASLNWLTNDKVAPARRVSAHYVVGKDGSIYNLVPDEYRAWHAGVSSYGGREDWNDFSIGIEIENANNGRDPYPTAQVESTARLVAHLASTHGIRPEDIVTHAQVAGERKNDPLGLNVNALIERAYSYIQQPATTSTRPGVPPAPKGIGRGTTRSRVVPDAFADAPAPIRAAVTGARIFGGALAREQDAVEQSGLAGNVAVNLVRGAGNVLSSVPMGVATGVAGLAGAADRALESVGLDGGTVARAQDMPLYQLGVVARDAMTPRRTAEEDRRSPLERQIGNVAGGIGSFLPFVATGALGGALRGAQAGRLVAGALGSMSMGGSQYDEAVRSGAGAEAAYKTYAVNAALGSLDAWSAMRTVARAGIGRVAGRVAAGTASEAAQLAATKAAERAVADAARRAAQGTLRRAAGTAGGVLRGGIRGGLEEGIEEAVQQAGSNFAASSRYIGGYDTDRRLDEGLVESAVAGGGAGLLVNIVGAMFGLRLGRGTGVPEARDGSTAPASPAAPRPMADAIREATAPDGTVEVAPGVRAIGNPTDQQVRDAVKGRPTTPRAATQPELQPLVDEAAAPPTPQPRGRQPRPAPEPVTPVLVTIQEDGTVTKPDGTPLPEGVTQQAALASENVIPVPATPENARAVVEQTVAAINGLLEQQRATYEPADALYGTIKVNQEIRAALEAKPGDDTSLERSRGAIDFRRNAWYRRTVSKSGPIPALSEWPTELRQQYNQHLVEVIEGRFQGTPAAAPTREDVKGEAFGAGPLSEQRGRASAILDNIVAGKYGPARQQVLLREVAELDRMLYNFSRGTWRVVVSVAGDGSRIGRTLERMGETRTVVGVVDTATNEMVDARPVPDAPAPVQEAAPAPTPSVAPEAAPVAEAVAPEPRATDGIYRNGGVTLKVSHYTNRNGEFVALTFYPTTPKRIAAEILQNSGREFEWNRANEYEGAGANEFWVTRSTPRSEMVAMAAIDAIEPQQRAAPAPQVDAVAEQPALVEAPVEPEAAPVEAAPEAAPEPEATEATATEPTATLEGPEGDTTTATGNDPNTPYEFRYRLVSLDSLIASHTDSFNLNPKFPAELQPRQRDRAASKEQIGRIAPNLAPDALLADTRRIDSGPMIVGPDGVVESGNGRTLALRAARANFPDSWNRYQQALVEHLPSVGLSAQDAESVTDPVLVRERLTEVDRVAFAAEANESTSLAMSPVEQALQDARRLTVEQVAGLTVGDTQTIDQALLSSTNAPLVRAFILSLPANERATVADSAGGLNRNAVPRLKNALFAFTYPGEAGGRLLNVFTESAASGVRTLESALYGSLSKMAPMEAMTRTGEREAGLSLADDLSRAVDVYARLKQENANVTEYLRQQTVFERELNPAQEALLGYINEYSRAPKVLRDAFTKYAQTVLDLPDARQMTLADLDRPTKGEILQSAFNIQADALPLFGQADAAPTQAPPTPAPQARAGLVEQGARRPAPERAADPERAAPAAEPEAEVAEVAPEPAKATRADAKRSRPKRRIDFARPLVGPSGARLLAYEWSWKYEEQQTADDVVTRRVSNWDEAVGSADTGRDVVHQFVVEQDGQQKVMSAESALRALGFTGTAKENGKQGALAKSVVSASRTLARLQMLKAEMDQTLAEYAAAEAEVDALPRPKAELDRDYQYQGVREFRGGDWWHMGDAYDYFYSRWDDARSIRTKLEQRWRRMRLKERGWTDSTTPGPAQIQKLDNRLKKAQQKLDALTQSAAATPEPAPEPESAPALLRDDAPTPPSLLDAIETAEDREERFALRAELEREMVEYVNDALKNGREATIMVGPRNGIRFSRANAPLRYGLDGAITYKQNGRTEAMFFTSLTDLARALGWQPGRVKANSPFVVPDKAVRAAPEATEPEAVQPSRPLSFLADETGSVDLGKLAAAFPSIPKTKLGKLAAAFKAGAITATGITVGGLGYVLTSDIGEEILRVEWDDEEDEYVATGYLADGFREALSDVPASFRENAFFATLSAFAQPSNWTQQVVGLSSLANPDLLEWRLPDEQMRSAEEREALDAMRRLLADPKSLNEQEQRALWETSRIAYSGPVAMYRAYLELSRMDNPTNEQITAVLESHENVWSTVAGTIVLDPLNAIGIGTIARGLRTPGGVGTKAFREWRQAQRAMGMARTGPTSRVWDWLARNADTLRLPEARASREARLSAMHLEAEIANAKDIPDLIRRALNFQLPTGGNLLDPAPAVAATGDAMRRAMAGATTVDEVARRAIAGGLGRLTSPVALAKRMTKQGITTVDDAVDFVVGLKTQPIIDKAARQAARQTLKLDEAIALAAPATLADAKSFVATYYYDRALARAASAAGQAPRAIRAIQGWNRVQKAILGNTLLRLNPSFNIGNSSFNVVQQAVDGLSAWGSADQMRRGMIETIGLVPEVAEEGFNIIGQAKGGKFDVELLASLQNFKGAYDHWFRAIWGQELGSTLKRAGLTGSNYDDAMRALGGVWHEDDAAAALADLVRANPAMSAIPDLSTLVRRVKRGGLAAADEARGITLLHYWDKTYFDVVLEAFYPFHYWQTRSMANWTMRLADSPAIGNVIGRIRDAIRDGINADLEDSDFKKDHIPVSAEWLDKLLPGDFLTGGGASDKYYVDLMSTLMPARQIWGLVPGAEGYQAEVDEELRNRPVNKALELLQVYPAGLTPLAFAAAGLGDRIFNWGLDRTRFEASIPLSFARPIRGFTAANREGIKRQTGIDVGPTGIDLNSPYRRALGWEERPEYEQKRVRESLREMLLDERITERQFKEIMRTQEGELWDEAVAKATRFYGDRGALSWLTRMSLRGTINPEVQRLQQEYFDIKEKHGEDSPEMEAWKAANPMNYSGYLTSLTNEEAREAASTSLLWDVSKTTRNEWRDKLEEIKNGDDPTAARKAAESLEALALFLDPDKRDTLTREQKLLLGEQAAMLLDNENEPERKRIEAEVDAEAAKKFPGWTDLQTQYYDLEDEYEGDELKAKQAEFKKANPTFEEARDWRREQLRERGGDIFPAETDWLNDPDAQRKTPVAEGTIEYAASLGLDVTGLNAYEAQQQIRGAETVAARAAGTTRSRIMQINEKVKAGLELTTRERELRSAYYDALRDPDAPRKPNAEPATDKQKEWLRTLGVRVTPGMTVDQANAESDRAKERAARTAGTSISTIERLEERQKKGWRLTAVENEYLSVYRDTLYANAPDPGDPPSASQIEFARKLGINTEGLTKREVEDEIDEAIAAAREYAGMTGMEHARIKDKPYAQRTAAEKEKMRRYNEALYPN